MTNLLNTIIVSRDANKALEYVNDEYGQYRICTFIKEKDEFLLEDAKAVVKEAYIAEINLKVLVLCAKAYRIETQNALLKILEEPPRNIIFVLIAPNKRVFLPTILSRVRVLELKNEKEKKSSGLNLKNLTEKEIFEFVKSNSRLDKNDTKEMIQTIVNEAILDYNIDFTEYELDMFGKFLELANLNSRPNQLFLSLLLLIKQRKNL
ncbi:DNA polymerase III subunit delta' [Sulfurospirillum sp. 1307]